VVSFTSGGQTVTLAVTQAGDDCGQSTASYCVWSAAATPVWGVLDSGADRDWFRFVAPVTGWYGFVSSATSGSDLYGTLYASNGSLVAYNDDGGGNLNFWVSATLTAGQVYFLEVRNWSSSAAAPVGYSVTAVLPW
jgi:hypothetical protein